MVQYVECRTGEQKVCTHKYCIEQANKDTKTFIEPIDEDHIIRGDD